MASPYIDQIRSFVKRYLLGHERALDTFTDIPLPMHRAFQQEGLSNWWLDRRYGGRGLSLEESVDVVAELAYGDAGAAFTFFVSILSSTAIHLFGSEELQDTWLLPMARTGGFAATVASEREPGSELWRITTVAEKRGAQYRLTGRKFFSTNSAFADFWIVYARTADDPVRFVALVVPKGAPGAKVVRRWPVIGLRSSGTYEVEFDNCPADALLDGNGLRILEVSLNTTRILIATTAVGVARRVRDVCIEYAQNKSLKGGLLVDNAVFADKIGQMEAQIDTMLCLCKAAAREFDQIMRSADPGDAFLRRGMLKSALVAKMICGQLGWHVASVGSEMFGGLGYTDDALIGKLVRDMRYVSIIEAGDDVIREVIYTRYVLPSAPPQA